MKKRIVIEATTLTDFEKIDLYNQGKRRENIAACKIDKLIRYYIIALDNQFALAKSRIEVELRQRNLPEFIVPMRILHEPSANDFTQDLARAVIDAKGDLTMLKKRALQNYLPSTTLVQAYTMALVFRETALATALEGCIRQIGTYTKYIKHYLELCMSSSAITGRLAELSKDMEDYKAWA